MAWLTWLTIHIYFLIGFRNRIAVFFEWAWTYFTFTHGARLITGSQELPGWSAQQGVEVASGNIPPDVPFDPTSPGFLEHHHGRIASQSASHPNETEKQPVS